MNDSKQTRLSSNKELAYWCGVAVVLAVTTTAIVPRLLAQDAATETKAATEKAAGEFSEYVDAEGNISLPKNFEKTFVHVGTVAVDSREGSVNSLHMTYTRPEDLAEFEKNGKFSDGAVLVKTVANVKKEKLTTGQTSFQSDVDVWFVMIKDEKGRFPDSDLWGSGWGWGLFDGGDRNEQIASDYRTECRTCHIPARQNDWVFTQCYPLLKKIEAGPKKKASGDPNPPAFDPADSK